MNKFKVGDKVVYPLHGAGKIESIEEKSIMNERQSYYIIKMPGEVKVMVPTAKANDVGVRDVFGLDDPKLLEINSVSFLKEHIMIPLTYIEELHGIEKYIFKKIYAGNFSKKLYKLYEFKR